MCHFYPYRPQYYIPYNPYPHGPINPNYCDYFPHTGKRPHPSNRNVLTPHKQFQENKMQQHTEEVECPREVAKLVSKICDNENALLVSVSHEEPTRYYDYWIVTYEAEEVL